MTAAPYTPETVRRIRAMAHTHMAPAIALELDWDLQRVRNVARQHGIELRGADPSQPSPPRQHGIELRGAVNVCPNCGHPIPTVGAAEQPPPPQQPPPPAPAEAAPAPDEVVPSDKVVGEIVWSANEREVRRGNVALSLPRSEAVVFAALLRARRNNTGPIRGVALSEALGINYAPIDVIRRTDLKLARLGLTIESRMGKNGGYSLADL